MSDHGPHITLLRRVAGEQLLVAEIEPRFLFLPEAVRTGVDLAIRAEGMPVFVAPGSAPDEEKRTGVWELFLRPQFRGPTWTVELAEPQAALLAPLARFRTVFPLVTLLSLLAVGLATLVLVRRSLVPIEQLQIATRRLAARDFSTRVGLATGDEFEELADSFDAMAANIEHHVSVVETVSSVGRALSVEQDAERLLATILRGTMSVTDARAGALSLCDPQDQLVRHLLLEWDAGDEEERPRRLQSLAEDTALAGRTLHEPERGDLSIPMRNHEGHVIGVLQLLRPGGFRGREPRAGRIARVADRRRAHEASPRRRVPRAVRGPDPADREGDRPEVALHRRALPPRPDPHRADRRRRLRARARAR